MMQVRGDVLFLLRHYIDHDYGSEGYAQWLDSLPPSSRQAVGPYLDVNRWYPVGDALVIPLRALCQLFYRGDLEGARDFGRHLADHMGLGRRAVIKLEEPQKAITMEARKLANYFGPGEVLVPLAAPYMTIVRLARFGPLDPMLEHMCGGYLERVAERSGGNEVQCQVTLLAQDAPFSELVVTWD
jgi:hypothetical protein